jgi:hypothetical protein
MDHLFCGRLKKRYFVFFGSEFLNIYLLRFVELLAFQEELCIMKLDTYYICILEIYYCLCHDPACEDIIAVFLDKSLRFQYSGHCHFMASLPTSKKPPVFTGVEKPL